MTDEQLAAIEVRLKAATPGPWEVDDGGNRTTHAIVYGNHLLGRFPVCELNKRDRFTTSHKPQREGPMQEANADFIAHAPTDIAALLAEVRRLRRAAMNARTAMGYMTNEEIADAAAILDRAIDARAAQEAK